MIRTLYLLAGVPLLGALMACSSESSTGDTPDAQAGLNFRAAEVASRASVITGDNITSKNFAVWGNMVLNGASTAPAGLFDATVVSHKGSVWTYADQQYWFPSHTYSFVALCPAPTEGSAVSPTYTPATGTITFPYTYPASYSSVDDMLVAVHSRKYLFGKGENTVAFKFMHIFSRVNFIANIDPKAEGTVTINHIALKGVGTSSTFAITPATLSSSAALGSSDDAYQETRAALWATPDTKGEIFNFGAAEAVTLPKNDNTSSRSHTYFPDDNVLLVIPQMLTEDVEVEVTYTRSTTGQQTTVSSKLLPIALAVHDGRWFPGQSYSYTFTLGDDDILFKVNPSAQDWEDSEGGNYII